jgi:ferric-dicitrate binding protein FerR (iron transport regulator)
MADHVDALLLTRYLSGECSAAEAALVERWTGEAPENRAMVDSLRAIWESRAVREMPDFDEDDRVWRRLASGMTRPTRPQLVSERPTPPRGWQVLSAPIMGSRTRRAWWSLAAAVVVIAVGLGTASARRAQRAARELAAKSAAAMRTIATKRGERANVYLSDGTRIVLGVASQLRFPTAFGNARDVELDGEAYFDIAHDTARIFTVHTAFGSARDVGTKFAVRGYQNGPNVTVTVVEGSVVLKPLAAGRANESGTARRVTMDSVILLKADVGVSTSDGRLTAVRGAPTDASLAWMSGRLVFDTTSVRQAVAQINRWYDADVRLGDSTLARQRLTASLTNEPFVQAIQIIAGALDAHVERRGTTYLLFTNHREQ